MLVCWGQPLLGQPLQIGRIDVAIWAAVMIAQQYLDVTLTPHDCESVISE